MPRASSFPARALLGAGALACGLAAALLAPWYAPRTEHGRAAALVVCDVSPSVTRTRPRWRDWLAGELAREAARADDAGAELVALAYGRERRFLDVPRGARDAAAWGDALAGLDVDGLARAADAEASDLWAALEALELRLGARALSRVTWISPGDFTGRDPSERLARLVARAAAWERREPPPAELGDLALVELDLPRAPAVGAPLVARLWLAGRGGTGARLDVRLETSAGPLAWSQRLEAQAFGAEPAPLELALGPAPAGTTQVELALAPDGGGDAVPENDLLRGTLRAGDDVSVAILAGAAQVADARALAAALAGVRGLAPRVVEPGELGAALAADDVLVHLAPDLTELPAAALESFLARGGGWLLCLGDEAPARAAWSSPAARLAPLELGPEGGEARDVLLLVDRSGSMAAPAAGGEQSALDEARAAALRLVELVPDGERVLLRTFAAELGPELDAAGEAAALLAPLAPGGATDIVGALGQLAEERARGSRAALALLVSDGRDQARQPGALEALRERLRAARIELEVLAVGAEPDLEFLGALAGEPRRLRVVAQSRDLGLALARAASASRERREGPYTVAAAAPLGAAARAALGGDGARAFPPLPSYLAARARPGAERALVAGPAREDLLALAPRGRGAAAALAATPRAADATWLAELLRWLAQGREFARPRLERHGARLALYDVPADWPPALWVERADGGPGEARLLPPPETVVDPRDRREGEWRGEPPPDGLFRLSSEGSGGPVLAVLAAEGPSAPEFARPPAWVRLPAVPEPVAAPAARAGHPLGRPVLMAALGLLALGGLLLGRGPGRNPVAQASDR